MKNSIISNLFITFLLIVPVLLKTFGISNSFTIGLVDSLPTLLIILTVLDLIGLICLDVVSKYANYINLSDLLDYTEKQERLENNLIFKIYKKISVVLFFGLLIYNRMNLTTIFACVWWLSNHLFKVKFDSFVKNMK